MFWKKKDKETQVNDISDDLVRIQDTVTKILDYQKDHFTQNAHYSEKAKQDFDVFRASIMKPLLEQKWRVEKIKKGLDTEKNIQTLGLKLVQMRREIYDEKIVNERQEKTQEVAVLNAKLEILNLVIGDAL